MRGRRIGERRPILTKAFGGALAERPLTVPRNEISQLIGRRQPERCQPLRSSLLRIGKSACRQSARSDDPSQPAALAQRQQSRRRGLDQPIVAERAIGARNSVESLVGCAERTRQRREVGLLGNGVGADQHALGANADRCGASLRGGDDAAGQEMANAIDFRAGARARLGQLRAPGLSQDRPRRPAFEPIFRPGAANGRPNHATRRHRWPPDAT